MEDSRKHLGKKSLVPGEVGLEKAGAGQGSTPTVLMLCAQEEKEQQSRVGEGNQHASDDRKK